MLLMRHLNELVQWLNNLIKLYEEVFSGYQGILSRCDVHLTVETELYIRGQTISHLTCLER